MYFRYSNILIRIYNDIENELENITMDSKKFFSRTESIIEIHRLINFCFIIILYLTILFFDHAERAFSSFGRTLMRILINKNILR